MNDPAATQRSIWKSRAALNITGAIILLLGVVSAGIVYGVGSAHSAELAAAADGAWQDGSLAPYDSKSFSHDVQLYNGTAGVLVMKWWDLCDELKRPGTMAIIIAAGSAIAAGGCFVAARRQQ